MHWHGDDDFGMFTIVPVKMDSRRHRSPGIAYRARVILPRNCTGANMSGRRRLSYSVDLRPAVDVVFAFEWVPKFDFAGMFDASEQVDVLNGHSVPRLVRGRTLEDAEVDD